MATRQERTSGCVDPARSNACYTDPVRDARGRLLALVAAAVMCSAVMSSVEVSANRAGVFAGSRGARHLVCEGADVRILHERGVASRRRGDGVDDVIACPRVVAEIGPHHWVLVARGPLSRDQARVDVLLFSFADEPMLSTIVSMIVPSSAHEPILRPRSDAVELVIDAPLVSARWLGEPMAERDLAGVRGFVVSTSSHRVLR